MHTEPVNLTYTTGVHELDHAQALPLAETNLHASARIVQTPCLHNAMHLNPNMHEHPIKRFACIGCHFRCLGMPKLAAVGFAQTA